MWRGICAGVVALSGCQFDGGGLPADDPDPAEPGAGDADASNLDAAGPVAEDASADARIPLDARRPPDARPAPCPINYARLGDAGTVYRLGNATSGWDAAEADCEDDGDGTHLVVLDDGDELAVVAPVIGAGDAWIGVTNRMSSATWLTVLGAVAPIQPWRGGAPSPGQGRACVVLLGETRELSNVACARASRYICECDGAEPDPRAF